MRNGSRMQNRAICKCQISRFLGDTAAFVPDHDGVLCLYVDDGIDAVCGLNQLIGSFSRSVPNKLLSRQKVTSGRDRWLFMGDSRAGTQLDPADNK